MKAFFLLVSICFSTILFSQNFTQVSLDNFVSVVLPNEYTQSDTLGQHLVRAEMNEAVAVVSSLPYDENAALQVKSEKNLTELYKGFVKGAVQAPNGVLLSEEVVEIGGLKALRFSARMDFAGAERIYHCLAVYLNRTMYSINIFEELGANEESIAERERILSSLTFAEGITLANQMVQSGTPEEESEALAHRLGSILGYVLVLALFIWGILALVKRKKSSSPK